MEKQVLISFIIPVYNIPTNMLYDCLNSIINLSLRRFEREIIIIDDGSDISQIKMLDKYLDDIIYIRQSNGGLGSARNRGLLNATGQYIQFIDADDTLICNQYEHCLDILRFSSPDMVLFDFCRKRNSQKVYNDKTAISGRELMHHNNIKATAWGYVFKKTILGNLKFTTGIFHEDEEFTPQLLLRAETIFVTSAKAYFYRKHEGSAINQESAESKERRLTDNRYVILRLHDLCDKLPQQDRLALQRRVAQLTMAHIYNTIRLSHSRQELNDCLDDLRKKGLFPLPDRDYTQKYKWFRKMTNSAIGRTILFETLPLLKKER